MISTLNCVRGGSLQADLIFPNKAFFIPIRSKCYLIGNSSSGEKQTKKPKSFHLPNTPNNLARTF
jgi:hypothetical protein